MTDTEKLERTLAEIDQIRTQLDKLISVKEALIANANNSLNLPNTYWEIKGYKLNFSASALQKYLRLGIQVEVYQMEKEIDVITTKLKNLIGL